MLPRINKVRPTCMATNIPSALKLSQLKSLAFQCGIASSGTKKLLINRLIHELVPTLPYHDSKKASPSRILSIDMGIRNLAYCIIDLPADSIPNNTSAFPNVTAWRRIAVSSTPILSESPHSKPKEAFDPQTLATAAYMLLRHTFLPHNPTHILIERQRFRSMGSPQILEWTVRVNMFESLLYGVLETLKAEKIWNGIVVPIAPGKVGPFWIESEKKSDAHMQRKPAASLLRGRAKVRTAKTAKLLNKGAKIDIVKTWLEAKQMLTLGNPMAESTARAYLEKWHRLPGRMKNQDAAEEYTSGEVEHMGKLDDLADSLLQGMAWIQWEKNKWEVHQRGVEALDLG